MDTNNSNGVSICLQIFSINQMRERDKYRLGSEKMTITMSFSDKHPKSCGTFTNGKIKSSLKSPPPHVLFALGESLNNDANTWSTFRRKNTYHMTIKSKYEMHILVGLVK